MKYQQKSAYIQDLDLHFKLKETKREFSFMFLESPSFLYFKPELVLGISYTQRFPRIQSIHPFLTPVSHTHGCAKFLNKNSKALWVKAKV